MNKNIYAPTPTVGAFHTDANSDFKQMLNTLSETFANEFQLDVNGDIKSILLHEGLSNSYKDILLKDYHQFSCNDSFGQEIHQLNTAKLEQLVENSASSILSEAGSSTLNPVVGLTLPLIKKNWIDNVMKDYIQTEIATTPVINRQVERIYLKDSEGNKYYVPDIFEEDMKEAKKAMQAGDRLLVKTDITVPANNYDLMTASGGSVRQRDTIARNFRIAEVTVQSASHGEQTKKVNIKPNVTTNDFSFPIVVEVEGESSPVVDMIFGHLDFEKGILNVASTAGKVKKIKVAGTLSAENNMKSASVGWETENKQFVIPTAQQMNTGLSEQKMKDDAVLYKVDSTAKAITDMSMVLNQFKDLAGLDYLDNSREEIKNTPKVFIKTTYDCKPQGTYAHTAVEYRAIELKDTLDNVAIELRKVLRTPNCFFAVMGNPRDVKLLGDINWTYTAGSDVVGGCQLSYSFGLMNGAHKFLVLSNDKVPQGALRVIVRPTTEEFISYIHYDYDFIISNNYRDPNQPLTPSVMAADRYLNDEITPIMGEIQILNNHLSATEMWKEE